MNYPRHYSEFLELINMKALADSDFRSALTNGNQDTRRTAIINLILSITDKNNKSAIESLFEELDEINVYTDTEEEINIVLSPEYDTDGPY